MTHNTLNPVPGELVKIPNGYKLVPVEGPNTEALLERIAVALEGHLVEWQKNNERNQKYNEWHYKRYEADDAEQAEKDRKYAEEKPAQDEKWKQFEDDRNRRQELAIEREQKQIELLEQTNAQLKLLADREARNRR